MRVMNSWKAAQTNTVSPWHSPKASLNRSHPGLAQLHFGQYGTIKILSYNMYNFTLKYNQNGNIVKNEKLKALANVIKNIKPDIIVGQEVTSKEKWLDFNKAYLDNQYPQITYFPSRDHNIGLAFISKPEFKLTDSESNLNHSLGDGSEAFQWRDFPSVLVQKKTNNQFIDLFRLYNFHFKSRRQGEESENIQHQLRESKGAAEILKKTIFMNKKLGILAMGDLNASLKTDHGKTMVENMKCDSQIKSLFFDAGSSVTHCSGKHYDYVFSRNLELVGIPRIIGQFDTYPWGTASDHLPIVTVVKQPNCLENYLEKYKAQRHLLEKVG